MEKIILYRGGNNMTIGVQWRNFLAGLLERDIPEPKVLLPSLPDAVEQARQEWIAAQYYYNTVADQDLIDYAVYGMQAAEKKYMYLLKQARQQGIMYSLYTDDHLGDEKHKTV
jgi:hypothetical protein